MTIEIVQTLDLKVVNSSTYSYNVLGGTLGDTNKLRLTAQCTTCLIEAYLSASGGTSVQILSVNGMFISSDTVTTQYGGSLSTVISDTTKAGYSSGTEDSSSDQTLSLSLATGTIQHATLEKISEPVDPEIPEPELPNTQIVILSKLCRLPHSIFKDVRFYAELLHNLDYMGIGTATFSRASSSTAVWRDGYSHTVGANEPRFEYSGDDPIGLRITTATESLSFPTTNNLSDAGTLFWKQDGTVKRTPTDTNPINGSGVWTGDTNVNISHLLKIDVNRSLTTAEINAVIAILNS